MNSLEKLPGKNFSVFPTKSYEAIAKHYIPTYIMLCKICYLVK